MMKKTHYNILMVNLPFSGHTNPTLGLAQILVQLGHNVTYINAPDWQSKIEKTGAHFVPYDHYPDSLSERQKNVKSWSAAYQTVLRMGKDYDCLIYEMLFFPGKALADRLNIPAYRLFSTFSLNEKILTEFGKTGGFYLTSIFRFTFLRHLLSRKLQRTFQLAYDDLAKEISLNTPELNFTYTVREFQIDADTFDENHYQYVGPSINRPVEPPFDFTPFKNPIIYISLGTLLNRSVSFFKKCIKAFENEPYSIIISLGNRIKKEQLGTMPANVHLYSFVPQLQILERASLFLTHGGMNSVNEAIYYGCPMLVIPVGNDQPRVAQQVADLHLGKCLKRHNLNPQKIKQAAHIILKDSSYKNTILHFQKIAQTAGGNTLIAQTIIKDLQTKP
ncbi:glycosyl transferase [Streptococcus mutans]|nr:glycosyl transferase [Streptococcus mutans]